MARMRIARFGVFILGLLELVVCLTVKKLKHRISNLENRSRNQSKQFYSLFNNTAGASPKASCLLAGESWDPLLNCFDASGPVEDVMRYHLRCKLKKQLASQTKAAWDQTLSFHADAKSSRQINLATYSANSTKQFRKCAVVSNSGVLRQHRHGDAIDIADVVFRFNDAPLKGWEKLVGSKESIRLVNNQFPERVLRHAIKSYEFDAKALYGLLNEEEGDVAKLGDFRKRYWTTSIQLLSPGLLKLFEETIRSSYDGSWFQNDGVSFSPTTGAIGMLSAMSRCDEVRAYGMAATPAAEKHPYHYYSEEDSYYKRDVQKADENTWHRSFKAEKDLWRRIAGNTLSEIDNTDVAVIPGFSQITCD